MNDKIEIKSLTGLIDQAQLSEIVSEIVSFYNGKIAALEKQISDLGGSNMATKVSTLETKVQALENQRVYLLAEPEATRK